MTDQELLDGGRVPSEPILAILRSHVRKADGDSPLDQMGELYWIAHRSGIPYDTLVTYMGAGRIQSIDFNTADALLCAMDKHEYWRGPDLCDIYYGVDLTWETCACNGCERNFQPGFDSLGRPKHTIYCSSACRVSAWKQNHGRNTKRMSASKRDLRTHCRNGHKRSEVGVDARGTCLQCLSDRRTEKCRNGHERTPENTIERRNGKIQCRICNNEASKSAYHRRREVAV